MSEPQRRHGAELVVARILDAPGHGAPKIGVRGPHKRGGLLLGRLHQRGQLSHEGAGLLATPTPFPRPLCEDCACSNAGKARQGGRRSKALHPSVLLPRPGPPQICFAQAPACNRRCCSPWKLCPDQRRRQTEASPPFCYQFRTGANKLGAGELLCICKSATSDSGLLPMSWLEPGPSFALQSSKYGGLLTPGHMAFWWWTVQSTMSTVPCI